MDTKQLLKGIKPMHSDSEDNSKTANNYPAIKVEPNDACNMPPVSVSNNQSQYLNIPVKTEIKTESIKQESIPPAVEPIFSSITTSGMNPRCFPTECGPCNVVLETSEAYYNHFLSEKHNSIVRRGIKVQKANDFSKSATKRPAQENETSSEFTSTASKSSRTIPDGSSVDKTNRDPRLKPKVTVEKKMTLAEYKDKHKANDQQLFTVFTKTKNEQDYPSSKSLPLSLDLQLQWTKQFDVVISPTIYSQCLQNKCLICNVSTTEVNNPKALSWHYLGEPHLMAVSRLIGVPPKTVAKDRTDAAKNLIPGSSGNTSQWKSFQICPNPPKETTVKPKRQDNFMPGIKISTIPNREIRLSHECSNFLTRTTLCKFCRQYKFKFERYKNRTFHQGQRVTIDYVADINKRELEYLENRKKASWTTFRTFGMRVFCFHPDVEDFALSSNIKGEAGPPKAFYGTRITCEFTMR